MGTRFAGSDRLAWIKRSGLGADHIGMIQTRICTHVRRPLPEVFGYVADVFNLPKWDRQVSSVTVQSPGPLVAGSRFRVRTTAYGRGPFDIAYLVTRLTPNSLVAATARAAPRVVNGVTVEDEGWIVFRIERSFTDLGAATRMDLLYRFDVHPFGGLTRWTDRILQRRLGRQLQRHERNLKRRIEQAAAQPRPPMETAAR